MTNRRGARGLRDRPNRLRVGHSLIAEGWRAVVRRWRRFVLSLIGVAVGVATLVATIGLTQTSANEIAATLASYSENSLTVRLPATQWDRPEAEIAERALQVPAVTAAGTFTALDERDIPASIRSIRSSGTLNAPIVVASTEGLKAQGVVVRSGTLASPLATSLDVKLLAVGSALARDLHVSTTPGSNLVELNGEQYTVTAVIDEAGEHSLLATAVVVPPSAVHILQAGHVARRVLVSFGRGDRAYVARYIAATVNPEQPTDASVESRPDPATLTRRITADTAGLIVVLSIVTTVAGAIGVANTMLIAVWERRSEVGVRRALGASRGQIGVLFLTESLLIGAIGGIVGWVAGVLASAGICEVRGWSLALPAWTAGLPLLGVIVGAVAGVHPAWRAARVDPAYLLHQ